MPGSSLPRSSLLPPLAAGGSRLYVLVLTKKMDVYENLGVFALPHEFQIYFISGRVACGSIFRGGCPTLTKWEEWLSRFLHKAKKP